MTFKKYISQTKNISHRIQAERSIGNHTVADQLVQLSTDIRSLIYRLDDNLLIATLEYIYFTDYSYEQIAEFMGCSSRTVSNRHTQALKKLEVIYNGRN